MLCPVVDSLFDGRHAGRDHENRDGVQHERGGLMITETTLPMAKGFDVKGIPEFDRSRKAMQYATSIDEYAAIMRKGNNGGYANSWLIGDRKTGEIAYLELGLRHTPLTKKKDGYFVSSNFAADPDLIHDDTPGFNPDDPESSMNARHIRAEQFMKEHYGQLDTTLAEAYPLQTTTTALSAKSMLAIAALAATRIYRPPARRSVALRPSQRMAL